MSCSGPLGGGTGIADMSGAAVARVFAGFGNLIWGYLLLVRAAEISRHPLWQDTPPRNTPPNKQHTIDTT